MNTPSKVVHVNWDKTLQFLLSKYNPTVQSLVDTTDKPHQMLEKYIKHCILPDEFKEMAIYEFFVTADDDYWEDSPFGDRRMN